MSSEKTNPKSGRKIKTLDEEIAAQREKLRKLEEREKNQKAVMELIKTERLDAVPSELWREAMPKIKALLVVESPKLEEPVQPVQPQVGTEQVEGGQ
jgi:hypothetical protein